MHFHLPFSAVEILWTLTFAAQLVLLVVLIGRERIQRFPWFTASIVVLALRLLAGRVLSDRLSRIAFGGVMITLADISIFLGLIVFAELARRAFRGARRSFVLVAALVILAIGGAVVAWWAPWPDWKSLTANSRLAVLLIMQLAAQKGEILLNVLAVEFGLVIVAFGRRFGAGWRSHAQRIAIGLSTAGLAQLAVERILRIMGSHFVPKSREEYEHVLNLAENISKTTGVITIAVLVWWIVCLWIDEPGSAKPSAAAPEKEYLSAEVPDQTAAGVESVAGDGDSREPDQAASTES